MALTPSNMLPLGTTISNFALLNTISGKTENWEDYKGNEGTLIIFMCNHCPYVVYLMDHLVRFTKANALKGIKTVAISSNDIEKYPADGPEKMKNLATVKHFDFPYFLDADQRIAKMMDAACTPDFYLLNKDNALVYRGRYDQARPGNDIPITGEDLQEAINDLLANRSTPVQYPSMGCNIKWKTEDGFPS